MQVIAREDKGILGKSWNKSDKIYFRTSSQNNPRPSVFTPQYWCPASYRGQTSQYGTSLSFFERMRRDGFNTFVQSFCSWLYKL